MTEQSPWGGKTDDSWIQSLPNGPSSGADAQTEVNWLGGASSTDIVIQSRKPENLRSRLSSRSFMVSSGSIVLVALVVWGIAARFNSGDTTSPPTVTPTNTPSPVRAEPSVDPYQQPKNMADLIRTVSASTVTVFCSDWSGSGWVIELDDAADSTEDDAYPYEIVTNHHVIEACVDGSNEITIRPTGSHLTYGAKLWSFDADNDYAVLMTDQYLPPLATVAASHAPKVGEWAMAVGSPGSAAGLLEGSVTTGHISNILDGTIVSDVTINPGNSGGPLVNVWGEVIATNTEKDTGDGVSNISYSFSVSRLCRVLVRCS